MPATSTYQITLNEIRVRRGLAIATELYTRLRAQREAACELRDYDAVLDLTDLTCELAGLIGTLGGDLPPEE